MAIGDDFEVQQDGDIRHISGSTHYTVIQFHRWLGDLADDAQASGGDYLDITDATPSERATDNLITLKSPYNIDDDAAQYLYDGSVVQKNGDEIYDGIVIIATQGMYLQVIQNGALVSPNFWTDGYNADSAAGYSHRFLLKVRTAGADIDGRKLIFTTREWMKTYSEFRIGTGTARGNNVAALNYQDDLNNTTAEGTVAGWTEINNTTEGYKLLQVDPPAAAAPYYSEWNKASYTINQFYERMKWLTRRDSASTLYGLDGDLFRGITHEVALTTPRTGTFPEYGALTWPTGEGQMLAIDSTTAATKMWIQLTKGVAPTNGQTITGPVGSGSPTATVAAGGSTERLPIPTPFIGVSTGSSIIGAYGVGIETADLSNLDKVFDLNTTQHTPPNQVQFSVSGLNTANGGDRVLVAPLGYSVEYTGESGGTGFAKGDTLSWTNPVGGGYLSEVLDLGTTGFLKIRLTSGSPPANDPATSVITDSTSGTTANAVAAAVACEDPRQLKLSTTLNGAAETQVVCTGAIPTDTPASGTIRIQLDTGYFRRVPYDSYSGSTFTIPSTDFTDPNDATGGAAEVGASIFVSYLDKNAGATSESFTSVYSSNRNLFVRVRFGYSGSPIKTFESAAVLTGAGGTIGAIRTSDA